MTDNVESIILEHLNSFRSELREMRSEMLAEFKDLKHRVSQLEIHALGTRRDGVAAHEDVYRQQSSIDRITERLERIERRLELV